MDEDFKIDNLDSEILILLSQNAMMPYSDIAKQLGVSGGTIHGRMKKLLQAGIVKGAYLDIDATKLGYDICAFVGVFLEKGSLYSPIVEQIVNIPEITEVHYTTGQYSIFLKVVCRNTHELRRVLNDKIQPIEGIQRTETFISLEEGIKRPIKVSGK